jgi:hypothetical protein
VKERLEAELEQLLMRWEATSGAAASFRSR